MAPEVACRYAINFYHPSTLLHPLPPIGCPKEFTIFWGRGAVYHYVHLFVTLLQKPEFCKLPPEVGPCKAAKPRFYYNATIDSCLLFTYGGCKGNSNRFKNEMECKKAASACISEVLQESAAIWFLVRLENSS